MTFDVNYFTLSGTDATNKYVTLDGTPVSSSSVALDVIGGTAQMYTTDFIVSGITVDWSGRGLDTTAPLVAGDLLRVIYDRS